MDKPEDRFLHRLFPPISDDCRVITSMSRYEYGGDVKGDVVTITRQIMLEGHPISTERIQLHAAQALEAANQILDWHREVEADDARA